MWQGVVTNVKVRSWQKTAPTRNLGPAQKIPLTWAERAEKRDLRSIAPRHSAKSKAWPMTIQ